MTFRRKSMEWNEAYQPYKPATVFLSDLYLAACGCITFLWTLLQRPRSRRDGEGVNQIYTRTIRSEILRPIFRLDRHNLLCPVRVLPHIDWARPAPLMQRQN
jgi:hypothetical protein